MDQALFPRSKVPADFVRVLSALREFSLVLLLLIIGVTGCASVEKPEEIDRERYRFPDAVLSLPIKWEGEEGLRHCSPNARERDGTTTLEMKIEDLIPYESLSEINPWMEYVNIYGLLKLEVKTSGRECGADKASFSITADVKMSAAFLKLQLASAAAKGTFELSGVPISEREKCEFGTPVPRPFGRLTYQIKTTDPTGNITKLIEEHLGDLKMEGWMEVGFKKLQTRACRMTQVSSSSSTTCGVCGEFKADAIEILLWYEKPKHWEKPIAFRTMTAKYPALVEFQSSGSDRLTTAQIEPDPDFEEQLVLSGLTMRHSPLRVVDEAFPHPLEASEQYVSFGEFRRGDIDRSGRVDLTDAILILNWLYNGDSSIDSFESWKAADVNDDGRIDIADSDFLLTHLFRGGPQPAAPFDEQGFDPTPDLLSSGFYGRIAVPRGFGGFMRELIHSSRP